MTKYSDFAALCILLAEREALKKSVFTGAQDDTVLRAVGVLRRVGGKTHLQIETFTTDGKARHENLPLTAEGQARLAQIAAGFTRINLLTTVGDAELKTTKKGEVVFLGADKLARKLAAGGASTVTIEGNNKEKKRILTGNEPFLKLLGVSDENGRVYDKKGAKFRQINRFLELVRDTLSHLPKDRIRIVDLCCGKSYLSFAVYHYFANVLGLSVSMTGVDLKSDVIAYCNEVAGKLGFTGLQFICGDVAAYESEEKPQLVVSLHACDTATDLVLGKAMEWQCEVILSTPCCHHELNHTLDCPELACIARHSMLRQKLCDAATDAMRLLLLEAHGYTTAALELIDPEETPKNVMLRAIRKKNPSKAAMEAAHKDYADAVRFFIRTSGQSQDQFFNRDI